MWSKNQKDLSFELCRCFNINNAFNNLSSTNTIQPTSGLGGSAGCWMNWDRDWLLLFDYWNIDSYSSYIEFFYTECFEMLNFLYWNSWDVDFFMLNFKNRIFWYIIVLHLIYFSIGIGHLPAGQHEPDARPLLFLVYCLCEGTHLVPVCPRCPYRHKPSHQRLHAWETVPVLTEDTLLTPLLTIKPGFQVIPEFLALTGNGIPFSLTWSQEWTECNCLKTGECSYSVKRSKI